MKPLDPLFNRVREKKMELHRQNLVDRLNKGNREDVPPLFWIGVFVVALLVMTL